MRGTDGKRGQVQMQQCHGEAAESDIDSQAASSVDDRISPSSSRCVFGIACDTCAPRKCPQCGTALDGGKCAPASAVLAIACGVCAPQKCIDSGTTLEEGEPAPAIAGCCLCLLFLAQSVLDHVTLIRKCFLPLRYMPPSEHFLSHYLNVR